MNNVEVKIPELVLDDNTGNTCLLYGSSKTGKTTLMMKLYEKYYNKKQYITTLFCINSQIDLYEGFKDLIVANVFNADCAKYIQLEKFINNKTKNEYKFVNLFDDIIDVRFSKIINNLILTYRNSNISTIMCLQYTNLLSKQARSNVNNLIFFAFNTEEAIEPLIKAYLYGLFRELGVAKEEMIKFYKVLTEDHNYIYLHPATSYLYSSKFGTLFSK